MPAVAELTNSANVQWSSVTSLWDADPWLFTALKKLAELARLPENWDGYGSRPVQLAAVEGTARLLAALASVSPPPPHFCPVPGGGVQLEWQVSSRELELEVLPNGSMEFLVVDEEGEMLEGRLAPNRFDEMRTLIGWLKREQSNVAGS